MRVLARKEEKMLNEVTLVGRVKKDIVLQKDKDKVFTTINVVVPRPCTIGEEIKSDLVPVKLEGMLAKKLQECYKENMILGIRGSIRNEDGFYINADKVSYLSSGGER